MTDVRSLLRDAHATRRITHPYASYTESGKLFCTVCNLQIKTESLWASHVKTPQHSIRLQRPQQLSEGPTKKRKADAGNDNGRKRVKGVAEDADCSDAEDEALSEDGKGPEAGLNEAQLEVVIAPASEPASNIHEDSTANTIEDDEEWAAFQREIAAADIVPAALAAIPASATISAAPISAEEIAAQAREAQSVQRGRGDIELEAEKEDAARALEDEFEEMEELEERVRKLREKREALRAAGASGNANETIDGATVRANGVSEIDRDSDSDDEADYDDWTFGNT